MNDDIRVCPFCGCRTNARLRACCDKGRQADLSYSRLNRVSSVVSEVRDKYDGDTSIMIRGVAYVPYKEIIDRINRALV